MGVIRPQEDGERAGRDSGTPALVVDEVSKAFGEGERAVQALDAVSVNVREGEFVTIIGPSGCGKSTLLHIIGGFEQPTTGKVALQGREVDRPGRDRGMVFQTATLYPWWTIERNVAWPIRIGGASRDDARSKARELLELVGLAGFERAYPSELSGGMQQRAALARTLSLEPDLLLMDEPFGALDAQTREEMQEELNRIWQASGITVVFVTHDIYEAIFLGDRVLVMSPRPGRFIECLDIELPRPRDPELKNSPELHDYHTRLWNLIRRRPAEVTDR